MKNTLYGFNPLMKCTGNSLVRFLIKFNSFESCARIFYKVITKSIRKLKFFLSYFILASRPNTSDENATFWKTFVRVEIVENFIFVDTCEHLTKQLLENDDLIVLEKFQAVSARLQVIDCFLFAN